ncbi:hypothetical protein DPX16_23897 [Anabarilius grahami]|uniref:Uncharacterized protein n=1 Tax=Anabarilius grahami TaxID=495550 RepID=A0A3N0YTD7_ANAGA|nr:hypothetical protein DPX16_23897 [Anabarilius grahami]
MPEVASDEESFILEESLPQSKGTIFLQSNGIISGGRQPKQTGPCMPKRRGLSPRPNHPRSPSVYFPSPAHSIIEKWTIRQPSTKLEYRTMPPFPAKDRVFFQHQAAAAGLQQATPQRRSSSLPAHTLHPIGSTPQEEQFKSFSSSFLNFHSHSIWINVDRGDCFCDLPF